MERAQKQLGQILIERKLISPQRLEEAVSEQKRTKEFLGAVLLRLGFIKEKELMAALSEQFNIPVTGLKNKYIDWSFVKTFSPSLILDHKCFPVEKDNTSITVAITDPLDAWALKKAEEESRGMKLKLVLVSADDMQDAIQRYKEYVHRNISNLFK
ncbi:MAG: hypothetical protein PHE18_07150 [Candidatus Omnitrophica bacterium]|nr:hypothetical protein [Candidatus Omnitrophota bacterium]MDD5553629.1 hypothetical protein [Candidatus Omnitrophota bacterium]